MTVTVDNKHDEREFGWTPDAWFCGVPDQRCRYCGLPVLFVPYCIEVEACTCDLPHTEDAGPNPAAAMSPKPQRAIAMKQRKIRIRSWTSTRFAIAISGGCIPPTRRVLNPGGIPSARRALVRAARAAASEEGVLA
jgi:hypothetical protein